VSTLYLDTAYNQIVGICDERGQWLGLQESVGQRSSALLHTDLHSLCQQSNLAPKDLKRVVYVAGPGFYTGLRIAFGIAQTMKLSGVDTRAFYTYDVPRFLGVTDYTWITKAYRGEVFVYQALDAKGGLMTEAEFLAREWKGKIYIHQERALDDKMLAKVPHFERTENLITKNFSVILNSVKDAPEAELYYFRAPEDEFRPNP